MHIDSEWVTKSHQPNLPIVEQSPLLHYIARELPRTAEEYLTIPNLKQQYLLTTAKYEDVGMSSFNLPIADFRLPKLPYIPLVHRHTRKKGG